ncbi:MAG: PDZ domain-containing protein [Candidatus Methylomirabilia bacterium]
MRLRLLLALLLVTVAVPALAAAPPWGWLGVRIRDLSEREMEEIALRHGIQEGFGVFIVEILADTPASRAGLESGDLVVAFGGLPVVDTRTLQRLVASSAVGEENVVTVLRSRGRQRLIVRLGAMPSELVAERIAAEFGFVIPNSRAEKSALPAPLSSIPRVAMVSAGSQAGRAGLKPGDLIVEVNGQPVSTGQDLREALLTVAVDQRLKLTVRRGEGWVRLILDPARP